MENTQYPRTGQPYELDEIMFIVWNVRHWGSDPESIKDIAKVVKRTPRSINLLLKAGREV